jgi:hypothetical protein
MCRIILPLLAMLSLAFAPAPFPKPERHPSPRTMAGVWDVDWGGMPARLDLRPDGSARFEYTKDIGRAPGGGPPIWDGSWRYEGARRLTLTLLNASIDRKPCDYVLAFSVLGRDAAEGKILDSSTSPRPLKLARSGRK